MTQAKNSNLFFELLHRLAEVVKAAWRRNSAANEVARLDKTEALCIARDLGVSIADLRALAGQDESAADLLVRRMASLNIDSNKLDPAVMRDLQRCCSLCVDKKLCIHEFEDKPREAMWPKYCPNEHTLAELPRKKLEPAEQTRAARSEDTERVRATFF